MVFFKTILVILLIYYGLKILAKMFAPKIFGYAAKKTEEHFREKFGEFAQQRVDEERIGDVIIKKKSSKKNTSKSDSSNTVGDYIDFEEID